MFSIVNMLISVVVLLQLGFGFAVPIAVKDLRSTTLDYAPDHLGTSLSIQLSKLGSETCDPLLFPLSSCKTASYLPVNTTKDKPKKRQNASIPPSYEGEYEEIQRRIELLTTETNGINGRIALISNQIDDLNNRLMYPSVYGYNSPSDATRVRDNLLAAREQLYAERNANQAEIRALSLRLDQLNEPLPPYQYVGFDGSSPKLDGPARDPHDDVL